MGSAALQLAHQVSFLLWHAAVQDASAAQEEEELGGLVLKDPEEQDKQDNVREVRLAGAPMPPSQPEQLQGRAEQLQGPGASRQLPCRRPAAVVGGEELGPSAHP